MPEPRIFPAAARGRSVRADMQYRILGPVEVVAGDRRVQPGGPLERALLARLVVAGGRVVALERLVEDLWEGDPPDSANVSVRVRVSRLRKALAEAGRAGAIRTQHPGYALVLTDDDTVDALEFDALAARGRAALTAGDAQRAAADLTGALALWRGPALADVGDVPFARAQGARLEELRLAALEDRIDADLALGRHATLVAELEELCAAQPLHERVWAQRMTALYRCGRQADALAAFSELRRTLAEELGLDPSPALVALEGQILAQSPALALDTPQAARGEPELPPPESRRPSVPLPEAVAAAAARLFVGRSNELDRLRERWDVAAAGTAGAVFLAGEPGIGKTRLVAELARCVHADGAVVLYGRSDEDGVLPYQPIVEALRGYTAALTADARRSVPRAGDLADLLPDLAPAAPAAASVDASEIARYRLFDAVVALLGHAAAAGPVLLILDDLHWADRPTLALLRHVLRFTGGAPLLVVGTYRESELARMRPFAEVLADLRRDRGFGRIALRGLGHDEVVDYLERTARHDVGRRGRALAKALLDTTAGNPFFLEQIVGHLVDTGRIVQRDDRWVLEDRIEDLGIPEGITEAVGRRLSRLSPACNALLAAASVVGRDFEVGVVELMTARDGDEVLSAIDEALAAGVVRELAAGAAPACTFSHALVQQALYEELSLARRQRMHLQAAEAIEATADAAEDGAVVALARHLRAAGAAADPAKTIDYSIRAMQAAWRVFAFEEALEHGAAALELMDLHGADDARRARLLEHLGDLRYLAGEDYQQGLADLERAVALFEEVGDTAGAARVHIKFGRNLSTFWTTFDLCSAREHLRHAQRLLGPSPPAPVAARLALVLGNTSLYHLDLDEGLAQAARAEALADELGSQTLRLSARCLRGWGLSCHGALADALTLLEAAWHEADRLDHLTTAFIATWVQAGLFLRLDPAEALRLNARERSKPRQQQASHVRTTLLVHAHVALTLMGRIDEARQLQDEVVSAPHLAVATMSVEFHLGDWDAAERRVAENLSRLEAGSNRFILGFALGWLGESRVMRGLNQAARAPLEEALAMVERVNVPAELMVHARLCIVDAEEGRLDSARAHLDRCGEITGGRPEWRGLLGQVALAAGALHAAAGAASAAEASFAEAAAVYERHHLPWWEAEALRRWGRALLGRGEHAAGMNRLDRALDAYTRIGASDPWRELVAADRHTPPP